MPARMDDDYNVVCPRGDTFGCVIKNFGSLRFGPNDRATMVVRDREGEMRMRKSADLTRDEIRFFLEPEDTMGLREGVYTWDITIETAETDEVHGLRKSLFAPGTRKFVIQGGKHG